jgi:endonuclease/exonuclease/phosphatase family metal-dependent hydrolase
VPGRATRHGERPSPDRPLRLLTLNVAHGRRTGPHQALLRNLVLERNLRDIALAVRRLGPDVVALQEADGPSAWSGNFDHVATLARLAELADYYRGEHNPFGLGRFRLSSGTALLARLPLVEPTSQRFGLSWRDTKGFVVATVTVPQWGGFELELVSVHLDFLTPAVRRKQIAHLVEALGERRRPRVLLGDLNCCWHREPRSMRLLTEALGLRAFAPQAQVPTFPSTRPRRRLDWILVSPELEFARYRTLPAPLSDHLAVLADVVPVAAA